MIKKVHPSDWLSKFPHPLPCLQLLQNVKGCRFARRPGEDLIDLQICQAAQGILESGFQLQQNWGRSDSHFGGSTTTATKMDQEK